MLKRESTPRKVDIHHIAMTNNITITGTVKRKDRHNMSNKNEVNNERRWECIMVVKVHQTRTPQTEI